MRLFIVVLLLSFSYPGFAGGSGNSRTIQDAQIKAEMEIEAEKKAEEEKLKAKEKQMAKKAEQERKELGKGSEQGQAKRDENSRKWWEFWED